MIEIPSAVIVARRAGPAAEIFQPRHERSDPYTLAVDRMNENIAHLYEPTHPAILRLIKAHGGRGARNGIWVGVCGEMAGDPVLTPLLLGLGVDELSAAPPLVPQLHSSAASSSSQRLR